MSLLNVSVLDNDRCGYGKCFCNNEFQIVVWDDDLIPIPHFHVIDAKTFGKEFHTRILIEKPEYYKGETTKFTNQQIKSMIQHFNSIEDKIDMFRTKWQTLLFFWNLNNQTKVTNQSIPDYTKLK